MSRSQSNHMHMIAHHRVGGDIDGEYRCKLLQALDDPAAPVLEVPAGVAMFKERGCPRVFHPGLRKSFGPGYNRSGLYPRARLSQKAEGWIRGPARTVVHRSVNRQAADSTPGMRRGRTATGCQSRKRS